MEQLVPHLCLVPSPHQVAVAAVRHNKPLLEQTVLMAALLAAVAVHFMVLAVVAEQEHQGKVLTVVQVSNKEALAVAVAVAVLLRLAQTQQHLFRVRAVQAWHHQFLERLSPTVVVVVVVLMLVLLESAARAVAVQVR